MAQPVFRLVKGDVEAVLRPISDLRWKVIRGTDLLPGDEVSPTRVISPMRAKERVNGFRTRLSPRNLVLVKGIEEKKSEAEVLALLLERPWDPDFPAA